MTDMRAAAIATERLKKANGVVDQMRVELRHIHDKHQEVMVALMELADKTTQAEATELELLIERFWPSA